jgi:RpiR family carbohydrate utilization transcriptional regulator
MSARKTMPAAGTATARIQSLLPSLRASDASVAKLILDDPLAIVHMTVSDAAAASKTSPSTVVRCCQALGFRGFHELKLTLAKEMAPGRLTMPGSIDEQDTPETILAKALTADMAALERALATVDTESFETTLLLLAEADRILLVGVGTSTPLAQDAAYRFLTIGLKAEAPTDVHVQHVTARLLAAGDVCFAISHTGSTRETVAAVEAAKSAGASIVALTSFARSPLTVLADVALVAGGAETAFRLEAMSSRIAHLAVIDALYIGLSLRDREGSVGALDKVSDVISEHRF